MRSKEQMRLHGGNGLKERAPRPATGKSGAVDRQPRPAAPVQRTRLQAGSATASDVLFLQRTMGNRAVGRLLARTADPRPIREKPAGIGLPENLKAGLEHLSGYAMDDVTVHYHSPRPAQLQAHAYARGTDIHLGPGQERHLPHEAWHVVQQKQGRVKPTFFGKVGGEAINDDIGLETEADVMGAESSRVGPNAIAQPKTPARSDNVIQAMHFERFRDWRRLVNFFYSEEETELLNLEKKAVELVGGLEKYYNKSLNPKLPPIFTAIKTEMENIKISAYDVSDYPEVKKKLSNIILKGDNISSKLARVDLPLEEGFDLSQEKAIPKETYRIDRSTTLRQVKEITDGLARKHDLADAVTLRELTDILVQFVSDSIIKIEPRLRPGAITMKAKLIDAATDIHAAYILATVNKDLVRANTLYTLGALKLVDPIFSRAAFATLSEQARDKAHPKLREASDKAYESSAILLASAFLKDGFVPDLVVGLPTGGVHAAHRVAAALSIITGKKPLMWATRPQGVKEESRRFMEGVGREDILSNDEVGHLVRALAGKKKANIAVVDDGFVSGKTLVMAKELYAEQLRSAGVDVDIRTGVIESEFNQMADEYNGNQNPADYVVVGSMGIAGKTGALYGEASGLSEDYPSLTVKHQEKAGVLSERSRFAELTVRDILEGK